MDPTIRELLQEEIEGYILDTLNYIETIRNFCDDRPEWVVKRNTELARMRDIKSQANPVSKSKNKAKAFMKNIWKSVMLGSSNRKALEKELGSVLQDTLQGLEKLQSFLEAVEKLAVTSQLVFMESFMPRGLNVTAMKSVISTARKVSPLLIHFKREANKFFIPSLSNMEVLDYQLQKYLEVTEKLSEEMEKTDDKVVKEWKNGKPLLTFTLNMRNGSAQKLHDHFRQLTKIRLDESFRLVYLFNQDAQRFVDLFKESHPQMLEFLSELEGNALKLDSMKKGSSISTVAGSTVSIAGGILSIVGLALAPVTAGVSLALTITGMSLGITSGVNSVVTGITEMVVNWHYGKNAKNISRSFMENVQKIQECLEQAASRQLPEVESLRGFTPLDAGKIILRTGAIGKSIDGIVDAASAVKALRSEEVARTAVTLGLQEAKASQGMPKLASDLPDIGQLAKGTPLALSKAARACFITLNVLFIGLDAVFIIKESLSLAKGNKNKASEVISSRLVLWRSELESWEKISDNLCKGMDEFDTRKATLERSLCLSIRSRMQKYIKTLFDHQKFNSELLLKCVLILISHCVISFLMCACLLKISS